MKKSVIAVFLLLALGLSVFVNAQKNIELNSLDAEIVFYAEGSPQEPYAMEFTRVNFRFKNLDANEISKDYLLSNTPQFEIDDFVVTNDLGYYPNGGYWNQYISNALNPGQIAQFGIDGYFKSAGSKKIIVTFEGKTFESFVDVLANPVCYDSDDGSTSSKGWAIGTVACTEQASCITMTRSEDTCDGDQLQEYNCLEDPRTNILRKYVEFIDCPDGCEDGACIGTAPQTTTTQPTNNAPVANDITASTNENMQVIVTLSYSDSDANDQAVSCSVTNVVGGSIIQSCSCSSGTCTVGLTPSQDSTDDITADYTVNDGDDNSNSASITVTVNPAGTAITCSGCLVDSSCLSFGTRTMVNNVPKYCASTGNLVTQKNDGVSCQNHYECKANDCDNNQCSASGVSLPPPTCNNGCLKDSTCLPFGTRLIVEGTPKYCAINGNIIGQKDDGATCQNNYECKANQCPNNKCGAPEAEEPGDIDCNGCLKDSTCLSFGTRIVEDDVPKYCDIAKEFIAQKEKEELCQNNYECLTNQCDDGVCGSLREELEETRNLLQGIIDWVRRVFGIEIGGDTCQDECSQDGSKQCSGNGFQTCGNYDSDSCLEWSSVTSCASGENCQNGQCVVTCQDECTADGVKQCSGNGFQTCGNHDTDTCLEWSVVTDCSAGTSCQDGECVSEPNIIILYESEAGELLQDPDSSVGYFEGYWYTNSHNVARKFYETHDDVYDFLAVFPTVEPTRPGTAASSSIINSDVEGIGMGTTHFIPDITTKLKSFITVSFYQTYWIYKNNDPGQLESLFNYETEKIILHEIGHNWCCGLNGFYPDRDIRIPAHWPGFIDLFYDNPDYVDSNQNTYWINDGDQYMCSSYSAQVKFSDLGLYLMGLMSPDEVAPVDVHEFEEIQGDTYYNQNGPQCHQEPAFTGTRMMSIQDIIAINGERIPSYAESQKDFRIAFIILVPFGQEVDSEFVNAVARLGGLLPQAWAEATGQRSTVILS